MSSDPVRVASLGMGWWSDVLAEAAGRSGALEIVACYTRSADKRGVFARQFGCKPAESYEEILEDDSIEWFAHVVGVSPPTVVLVPFEPPPVGMRSEV